MELQDQLRERGWYLTPEGIEECCEGLENSNVNAIIQKALDCDLRDIGGKFLPEDISRGRIETISGPATLQIQKIRNVSSPKLNNGYTGAPDLLKVQLTDGHTTCNAIQWGNWKSVSQEIPPGTKLYLKPGKIKVQNNFLVLTENQFKVLGGDVNALVEKWELSRSLACHIRATTGSDGGPPPWIPFGQHIDTNSLKNIRDNFRSLDQTQKDGKENEAFEQQRKANIAEIARTKEGKKKIFGGGKQIQEAETNVSYSYNRQVNSNTKIGNVDSGTTQPLHQNSSKTQMNNRRENKNVNSSSKQEQTIKKREKPGQQTEVQNRPSAGSTLFDFLQSQISLPAEVNSGSSDSGVSTTVSSSQSVPTKETNSSSRNLTQQSQFSREGDDNKHRKNIRNTPHSDQRTNFRKTNFHVSQSNHEKPVNEKYRNNTGQVGDHHIRNNTRNFKESERRNRPFERNTGSDTTSGYYAEGKINGKPNRGRHFCDDNESFYEKRTNRLDGYGDNHFHSSTQVPYKNTEQQFKPKEGDRVLAKYWEDNKLYPAVVHASSPNGATCVVHFVDYGNYEEVLMEDIRPLTTDWNCNSRPSGSSSTNAQTFPNGILQQNFVGTLEFRRGRNKPYVHNTDATESLPHGQKKEGTNRPSRQLYQPPAQRRHPLP